MNEKDVGAKEQMAAGEEPEKEKGKGKPKEPAA